MEILELILKRYGKFDNHKITLKPGINIIYGGNETGKSTIHSFIRAMLFGLNRGRGRAAGKDEYQIRQPWDSPGAFLGSMRIREGGKVYRIDRCFDRSTSPLQVVCETDAQEIANPQQALDVLLGGISENAFVNTVFIPQAQCETDEVLAQELRRYMVNSDSTMDAGLDVSSALQGLRKKKKMFEQKKKKEEAAMEERIREKQAKAEVIRAEIEILRQQEQMQRRGKAGTGPRPDAEAGERTQHFRVDRILELLLFLAGLLALACAYFLTEMKVKLFLGAFGVLFMILIFPVHFLLGDDSDDDPDEEEEFRPEDEEHGKYILEEIRNREEVYGRLQDELEALYHSHVKLDGTDAEIAALTLAIDRICELSSGIYAKSGGQLNEQASKILEEITEGRYKRIVLDETMEVRIHTASRVLGLHQVSGGTMQQIYFALRIAVGELLTGGRRLPVILDETFAMYDDARLEAALRWLKKSGRQVILFTCQKREREILESL